ncbi:hypothetical protein KZ810_02855 [Sphingomonas sp. RHCKR47]|uniref:hypothetical protein n=1 Tax=Sphingomonas citricola TaxID=2862498 RepID=UPI001CA59F5D|nr:hypothetical protein [Sphingomonas citricola]MBW6522427.1 hypothetical protein [Sphingomonas citricola]
MLKPRLDPSIIDSAPIAPTASEQGDDDSYLTVIGQLASELEARDAELARIAAKKTVDEVKAQMLERYSDNVFRFVVCYCIAVGCMLLLAGFHKHTDFELPDTILAIIAGSTAVSVIGLIGMVVSGLFGRSKTAMPKKRYGKSKSPAS